MKKYPLLLLLFILALVSPKQSSAQSLQPTVIASDGGFAVLSSGTISWTLGEVVTETFSSPSNFLTQGFQQPSLVLMNHVGDVEPNLLFVYPNPATDLININLSYLPAGEYKIELFDLLGNKVADMNIVNSGFFSLPLSPYANGMYMLTVSSANLTQSYKVIKSK